jgi:hypothetical protein
MNKSHNFPRVNKPRYNAKKRHPLPDRIADTISTACFAISSVILVLHIVVVELLLIKFLGLLVVLVALPTKIAIAYQKYSITPALLLRLWKEYAIRKSFRTRVITSLVMCFITYSIALCICGIGLVYPGILEGVYMIGESYFQKNIIPLTLLMLVFSVSTFFIILVQDNNNNNKQQQTINDKKQ